MRCLFFLGLVLVVQGNEYIRSPYRTDSEFNAGDIKFGTNTMINCSNADYPDPNNIEYWILPNTLVLTKGKCEPFEDIIDGNSSWCLNADGKTMHLSNVRERHFGLYHCVFGSGSAKMVIKRGLNYQGPYFGSIGELYRNNFMIGGIAAAVFLVLAGTVYTIYRFRYKDDDDVDDDMQTGGLYANGGMSKSSPRYEDVDISPHTVSARTAHSNPTYANENFTAL